MTSFDPWLREQITSSIASSLGLSPVHTETLAFSLSSPLNVIKPDDNCLSLRYWLSTALYRCELPSFNASRREALAFSTYTRMSSGRDRCRLIYCFSGMSANSSTEYLMEQFLIIL